ncbi:hypothetical protein [Shewanella surugensis]|uniref:Uncharacterized protein n=1 Tax=Shewanella surugensis TaxID=212020 RepID=A0ABT0L9X8_9GAMM|nr:hypothetical protein [Shewanella surugensis]MCL1124493.1 hypothetical protein [Shewanella surugensis]
MGVLHSTNADKLLQNQLKKTITNAIEKFNVEIAKQGIDNVTVSLNGVKIKILPTKKPSLAMLLTSKLT